MRGRVRNEEKCNMDLMEKHCECTRKVERMGGGSEDWKKWDERRGTERLHFIFP